MLAIKISLHFLVGIKQQSMFVDQLKELGMQLG
jgi:hypothetical protein